MNDFERRITFEPAYDKGKAYGIGAMRIRFVLIGPAGAIQFLMGTGWNLAHVRKNLARKEAEWLMEHGTSLFFGPQAWDIGYHSPVPQYEGQEPMAECDILPSGKCYYDGSGLNAEPIMERFIGEGTEYLWAELQRRYDEMFGALAGDRPQGEAKVEAKVSERSLDAIATALVLVAIAILIHGCATVWAGR